MICKNPEIDKMMTLSMSHLRPFTRERMEEEQETNLLGLVMYNKDTFGWYVYIHDDALKAMNESILVQDFLDLYTCIQFARQHDCTILCFDCDAEPTGGLAFYPDDDSDKSDIAYIYTACYAEPCGLNTVYSRHATIVTTNEAEALQLISDTKYRNVLTRVWYYGNQKMRQRYDWLNKIWVDHPAAPEEACHD